MKVNDKMKIRSPNRGVDPKGVFTVDINVQSRHGDSLLLSLDIGSNEEAESTQLEEKHRQSHHGFSVYA